MRQFTRKQTIWMLIALAFLVLYEIAVVLHGLSDRHFYRTESAWETLIFDHGFQDDGYLLREMRRSQKGKPTPSPLPAPR